MAGRNSPPTPAAAAAAAAAALFFLRSNAGGVARPGSAPADYTAPAAPPPLPACFAISSRSSPGLLRNLPKLLSWPASQSPQAPLPVCFAISSRSSPGLPRNLPKLLSWPALQSPQARTRANSDPGAASPGCKSDPGAPNPVEPWVWVPLAGLTLAWGVTEPEMIGTGSWAGWRGWTPAEQLRDSTPEGPGLLPVCRLCTRQIFPVLGLNIRQCSLLY